MEGTGVERLYWEISCGPRAPAWVNLGKWFALASGALMVPAAAELGWRAGGLWVVSGPLLALPLAYIAAWVAAMWWRGLANGLLGRAPLEVALDELGGAWRRGQGPWVRLVDGLRLRRDGALCDGGQVLGWDLFGARKFAAVARAWDARRAGKTLLEVAQVRLAPDGVTPNGLRFAVDLDGWRLWMDRWSPFAVAPWVFSAAWPFLAVIGPPAVAVVAGGLGGSALVALGLAVPLGALIATLTAACLAVAAVVPFVLVEPDERTRRNFAVDPYHGPVIRVTGEAVRVKLQGTERVWPLDGLSVQVRVLPGVRQARLCLGRPGEEEEEVGRAHAASLVWWGRAIAALVREPGEGTDAVPSALAELLARSEPGAPRG